jgi:hypothetical protein
MNAGIYAALRAPLSPRRRTDLPPHVGMTQNYTVSLFLPPQFHVSF